MGFLVRLDFFPRYPDRNHRGGRGGVRQVFRRARAKVGNEWEDAILGQVKDLNINIKIPIPWMDEPLTFFKREDFTIYNGQMVAVVLVMFLTILNSRGIREGKWVQNIFTVAKTCALIALIVVGLTVAYNSAAVERNFSQAWDGITGTAQFQEVSKFMPWAPLAIVMVVCGAMVGSLFSADAWHNVTFTAGEVRNPKRNLPRAWYWARDW